MRNLIINVDTHTILLVHLHHVLMNPMFLVPILQLAHNMGLDLEAHFRSAKDKTNKLLQLSPKLDSRLQCILKCWDFEKYIS